MHCAQIPHTDQQRPGILNRTKKLILSNRQTILTPQISRVWTRSRLEHNNKRQVLAWATSTDNATLDRQDAHPSDGDDETDYVVIGSGIGGKLLP